ncbi:hypothetical protein ACQ4M3_30610 [Leptolyngbya sp. AN03gr2]|uniref:hypothetical protein n=1 Tax=unclassified Leptolyngbya TaxID=2650499 RepID=UPI003D312C89
MLETAPDSAVEQTLQYLKSILPDLSHEDSSISRSRSRSQWVDQLRQRRARVSVSHGEQTVIEMRQEERF